MYYGIEGLATKKPVERRFNRSVVGEVRLDELDSANRFPVTLAQVVENDDAFSSAHQLANGVRANIAGSTGD
jgi:hypothetical protein